MPIMNKDENVYGHQNVFLHVSVKDQHINLISNYIVFQNNM